MHSYTYDIERVTKELYIAENVSDTRVPKGTLVFVPIDEEVPEGWVRFGPKKRSTNG